MTKISNLYWWRPFSTARDATISAIKYNQTWMHLLLHGGKAQNFGDEASPLLLSELTDNNFKRSDIGRAEYLGVGSVLNTAIRDGFSGSVIGSGLRKPCSPTTEEIKNLDFIGVRGHLTAKSLGLDENTVIGDPGLAIKELYPRAAKERKTSTRILIPHFEVLNSHSGRSKLRELHNVGWTVILPNEHPLVVAENIRKADFVASSSLHGYIFAHSYGVPATMVSFTSNSHEPDFKFNDYLSVFGLSHAPIASTKLHTCKVNSFIEDLEETTFRVNRRIDPILANMYDTVRKATN